jgi:hypothetical protein
MSTTHITPVEPGNRVQLPADWASALGLHGLVALDRTSNGILVRALPPTTWDDIFGTRLTIGSAPPEAIADAVEGKGDDFLF